MYDHHDDNHNLYDDDDDDHSCVHDIGFLQMREAEQRLTEEQETMLGLQVEPNKVFWQSEFLRPFLGGLLHFGGY